ncbi:MAG: ribonuclease PH [Anaerolineae bacterium]|jgi:ribonuclease PH
MTRIDGRADDELRPVRFVTDFVTYPEGSVLIETGGTCVLCNVSIEEKVPPWREPSGGGWLTAEYAMLPRATHTRTPRSVGAGGARSHEIRRLIGRALRAAVDLDRLGMHTLTVDCDVLQADGGTRTAAITGGYVAVALALWRMIETGNLPSDVLATPVGAVSVGLVAGRPLLDLCYAEDATADADMNVVMTGDGRFVEVQGTAEGSPFDRAALDQLLDLAARGIEQLIHFQNEALAKIGVAFL